MLKTINFQNTHFVKSVKDSKFILTDKTNIAFLGRSNVGKSSLINAIVKNNNLMKTSKTPGLTKMLNYAIVDNTFYLVDLPGYGFALKDRDYFEDLINSFLCENPMLKMVYLLVDSRRLLLPADVDFLNFFKLNNVPTTIVFTKIDKLNKSDEHFLHLQEEKLSEYKLFKVSKNNLSSIDALRKDIIKNVI